MQAVGYEDFVYMPKETLAYRYVCVDHFTENDVLKTGVRPKLSIAAIPSNFPNGHAPLSDELANEWPPKLEWECGEPEPRKPRPPVIREVKTSIPCPDCTTTTASDTLAPGKRKMSISSSPVKAKRIAATFQTQPQSVDIPDDDVIESGKSHDVSSLEPGNLILKVFSSVATQLNWRLILCGYFTESK